MSDNMYIRSGVQNKRFDMPFEGENWFRNFENQSVAMMRMVRCFQEHVLNLCSYKI